MACKDREIYGIHACHYDERVHTVGLALLNIKYDSHDVSAISA